jgi:hypothetical protein
MIIAKVSNEKLKSIMKNKSPINLVKKLAYSTSFI